MKGTFWFDEQDPAKSHVEVAIGADSATFSKEANKGEVVRDIISGERFLKIKDFPVINFKSTKVVKTSNIIGGRDR